ncbi:transposable element Tcb2 transposase [Trichonephila clavipes]|nr:transposable element Tcb2 transposase [Trichonephila clavipes]
MVLKANDRRTSCPCHDEFRGPRSDYVRQGENPGSSQGPPNSLLIPPTTREDLRVDDYLEYSHTAKAPYIYKHPCLLRDSNPVPTAPHSASLTTKPVGRQYSNDEVEKLAYQLNEEAEWTERPIRRLSKGVYGSTCADMQVDIMGECLSSIKHVVGPEMANNQSVRRHLDAFTGGRIIRKLEEGHSVTRTAIRGFSSGRPRGTTPAVNRYIVLQSRRNRRQKAGEIARHTTQATGRPISRFTVARRLHGCGLFARRRVRCVPLMPAHRRRLSLWCR